MIQMGETMLGNKTARNEIDYSDLDNKVYKKAFKLSDVKDRLETVAFDIVKFKDDDKGATLWQVQSSDDGDYIVALYQQNEEEVKTASWEVSINKLASTMQISYKGDPIVKIASDKLGIPKSELHKTLAYLPEKLAENKKLVRALLNELSVSAKNTVLNKYPELL